MITTQQQEYSPSVTATSTRQELITPPRSHQPLLISVNANEHYEGAVLIIGAGEISLRLALVGEHASANIAALILTKNSEHAALTVSIEHAAQQSTSRLTVHSVAADNSSIEASGLASITAKGAKSDANIQFRSLLLSPDARVRVKPEFTLSVDDVACKHGASIGPLDALALSYCATRGIGAVAAVKLILNSFGTPCYTAAPPAEKNALMAQVTEWIENHYANAA